MNNNLIEPCCAERQLSILFREERGHAVAFQTNGDVTLEHFLKAIMLLSGDRPRTLTLSVPIFTAPMLRVIAKYLRLEWVAQLRLMTTDPLPPEHLQQLAARIYPSATVPEASPATASEASPATVPEASASLLSRIELAADASIPDDLLAFTGTDGTVVIQGRLYDTVTPRLSLYAGIYGRTEGRAVRTVMDAWLSRFRARRYDANEKLEAANHSRNIEISKSRNLESGQIEKSKSRKTKKSKKNEESVPSVAIQSQP